MLQIFAAACAVCAIVASVVAIFVARRKSVVAVRWSSLLTLISAAFAIAAVVLVLLR